MRRGPAVFLIALTLIGCVRHSDLGGAAQSNECTVDCASLDAGAISLDGGPTRPGSRLDSSGGLAEIAAVLDELEGTWWGSAMESQGLTDDEVRTRIFQVTFVSTTEVGEGSFFVNCADEPFCDPFGLGSASPRGGRIKILNLSPEMPTMASGEFAWVSGSASEPVSLAAAFRDLERRDEPDGPTLTFGVGPVLGGLDARVIRRVVLTLGPLPAEYTVTYEGAP